MAEEEDVQLPQLASCLTPEQDEDLAMRFGKPDCIG